MRVFYLSACSCDATYHTYTYNFLRFLAYLALTSKWILLSNILQKMFKASVWMRITIPSPPHKFMKVFYQKVRVRVILHFLELFFHSRPIAFCMLCVYPSDGVDKLQGMIDCSVIETQSSLHLVICCPLVGVHN